MRFTILTAALLSVLVLSCSKKDDPSPNNNNNTNTQDSTNKQPTTVTPKAKEGTFLIDGIEYKPGVIKTQVDHDDYIIQGVAANGGTGLLQVRFGDKPAAGKYAVEESKPQSGSFTAATSGKFNIYTWGTETGSMAWSTATSTGDAQVTINGNKMTVVVNDVIIKRGLEDKTHTVSVNFTADMQ